MTGKELIIYILQNNLENDGISDIFSNLFLSESQLAAKFNVGVDTIRVWRSMGFIDGVTVGNVIFYRCDIKDPRIRKQLS